MRNINSGDKENDNFSELLNKFEAIKEGNTKESSSLIEETKQREPLTSRQREAIIARCKHSIEGTYGNTKHSGVKMKSV